MKHIFTRYVIQREDGKFYYRGAISSVRGYTNDIEKALLFEQQWRASLSAVRESNVVKVKVKKVKVTIEME